MKPIAKFANLPKSGLMHRIAKDVDDDRKSAKSTKPPKSVARQENRIPRPEVRSLVPEDDQRQPAATNAAQARYQKWRLANPELYLERQRVYQARHKAKKIKAEKTP